MTLYAAEHVKLPACTNNRTHQQGPARPGADKLIDKALIEHLITPLPILSYLFTLSLYKTRAPATHRICYEERVWHFKGHQGLAENLDNTAGRAADFFFLIAGERDIGCGRL